MVHIVKRYRLKVLDLLIIVDLRNKNNKVFSPIKRKHNMVEEILKGLKEMRLGIHRIKTSPL